MRKTKKPIRKRAFLSLKMKFLGVCSNLKNDLKWPWLITTPSSTCASLSPCSLGRWRRRCCSPAASRRPGPGGSAGRTSRGGTTWSHPWLPACSGRTRPWQKREDETTSRRSTRIQVRFRQQSVGTYYCLRQVVTTHGAGKNPKLTKRLFKTSKNRRYLGIRKIVAEYFLLNLTIFSLN